MISEFAMDSADEADKAIIGLHGIKETTYANKSPGDDPAFEELLSKLRQKLCIQPVMPCDDQASPPGNPYPILRLQFEDSGHVSHLRQRSLCEIWESCTANVPLNLESSRLTSTRIRDSSSPYVWSVIGQIISAIALFLMTIAAALAIHWLVGPSDMVTPDVIRSPIETCDVCGPELLTADVIEALGFALRREVFGQDLAVETLMQTLSEHFSWNRSSEEQFKSEPIVVVLHGGTGTGKTYTARIMSRHFSWAGMKVHWYIPILNRHKSRASEPITTMLHRSEHVLLDWVIAVSSTCSSAQVFILDDVDANDELAFQLEAVVFYWKSMTFAVDTIGPIFVITSSKESEFLERSLLDHITHGNSREGFSRDVVQWKCPFGHELQATYVPFLPIQSEHLKECIRHALRAGMTVRGVPADDMTPSGMEKEEEEIQAVINRTNFVPVKCPLFAKYGCKQLQLV